MLETVIQRLVIPKRKSVNLTELEEQYQLSLESGFGQRLFELKKAIIIEKAREQGYTVVLQRPVFRSIYFSFLDWNLKAYQKGYRRCIPLTPIVYIQVKHRKAVKDQTCFWEVKPRDFKAYVPMNVLRAAVKAKQLGLALKVWFVSKVSEYSQYVEELIRDPAIVGYPILAEMVDGEPVRQTSTHVILLGLWGQDIEQLNDVLERFNNSNQQQAHTMVTENLVYCIHCGKEIGYESNFGNYCQYCGKPVKRGE